MTFDQDKTASDFIDVRRAFVDYPLPKPWWSLKRPAVRSALRDVSLQIPLGARAVVFGAPGSGKTTLLRLLCGRLAPGHGSVRINGRPPGGSQIAAGYVAAHNSLTDTITGYELLSAFARKHKLDNAPARITEISDALQIGRDLHIPASALSDSARLRLYISRAALSDSPMILLDDAADILGSEEVTGIIDTIFTGRTVLTATRRASTAQALDQPLLLMHHGHLAHRGSLEDIASALAAPRTVDVWIEGLRYDVLRNVRRHPGVLEARLIPTKRFSGQKLRIRLQSSRYLPALYDTISHTPLVKVVEIPPSLNELAERL